MISGKGESIDTVLLTERYATKYSIDTTRYREQFNKLAKKEGIEWVQDEVNPGKVDPEEIKIDTVTLDPAIRKETSIGNNGRVLQMNPLLLNKISDLRVVLETKRMEQVEKALGPQFQRSKITVFDPSRLSGPSRQAFSHFMSINRLTEELHQLWQDRRMQQYQSQIEQQAKKGDPFSIRMFQRGSSLDCGRLEPGEIECSLVSDYPTLDPNSLAWPEGFATGDLEKLASRPYSAEKSMLMSPYTIVERDASGQLTAIPYTDHPVLQGPLFQVAAEFEAIARIPGISDSLRLTAEAYAHAIRNEKPEMTNGYNPFAKAEYVWATVFDGDLAFTWGPFEERDPLGIKRSFQFVLFAPRRESMDAIRKNMNVLPDVEAGIAARVPGYQARPMKVSSILHVSDVIMRAGDMHPQGGEYLAHVLPNDGPLVDQGRTRREIFANLHDGKGEFILLPLAKILLVPEQIPLVNVGHFVETSANHELCHTAGPRPEHEVTTPDGRRMRADVATGTSQYGFLEESKADLGGLSIYAEMLKKGMISKEEVRRAYATDIISKIRQTRMGKKSPHGAGAKSQLGFFFKTGAIRVVRRKIGSETQDRLEVNFDKMPRAIEDLLTIVAGIQQRGDAKGAKEYGAYSNDMPDAQFGDNGTFVRRIKESVPIIPIDITLKARFVGWGG